ELGKPLPVCPRCRVVSQPGPDGLPRPATPEVLEAHEEMVALHDRFDEAKRPLRMHVAGAFGSGGRDFDLDGPAEGGLIFAGFVVAGLAALFLWKGLVMVGLLILLLGEAGI